MSGARHQRVGRTEGGRAARMPASPPQQGRSGSSGKPSPSPSQSSSPSPSHPCSTTASSSEMSSTRLPRGGGRGGDWGADSPDSPQLREQSVSPVTRLHYAQPSPMSGSSASPGESLSATLSDESKGGGRNGSKPFDIFRSAQAALSLKPSLLVKNKEKRALEEKARSGPGHKIPRPGMVLLKNFLSHENQVHILKQCRTLGLGRGGFYKPGYRDGAKLSLQMMCLGKNWDPDTKRYEETRSFDGTVPPGIPETFKNLVANAMLTAHKLIREMGQGNATEELPELSPDLCIVNFYEASGKLGLHQDRDESEDSLRKGLPVVSFSIGDSAIFKYGDTRNEVEEITLESGDVLIFGGKSRHVFHGITTIDGGTAPKRLIEDTLLRPGRLNLTFRQY